MINKTDHDRAWRGAAWKINAFICYALINTLVRYLSGGSQVQPLQILPVNMILFSQDAIALVIILPWILKKIPIVKIDYLRWHLLRVFLSAGAMITWYLALSCIPQVEAVALAVVGPLMGCFGAQFFLKEAISKKRAILILITFCMALMISYRTFQMDPLKHMRLEWSYVFVSSILFASAKVTTRYLASQGESVQKLTLYLLILMVPSTFIPALYVWVTPQIVLMPWLLCGGGLTVFAIYSGSMALSYAEISFLTPFDFIQVILNALLGYYVFTEIPSRWTGGVLIFLISALGLGFSRRLYQRFR